MTKRMGRKFARRDARFPSPTQLGFTRVGHLTWSKSDTSDFDVGEGAVAKRRRMRGSLRGDRPLIRLAAASRQRSTFSHKGRRKRRMPLPRAESRGAEQRLLRRGLRAPVLRRRENLATEFGGGVPAPARVVEHGTRERDHVGLAGRNDLFSLLRFRDQADGDGGKPGGLPDRLREQHLVAGTERYLLQRRDAARR